jgi:hypothetical protein
MPMRIISFLIAFAMMQSLEACSVCFSAKEGSRYAYYGTTVLLSLVPLFMVGFFIRWAFKRVKEIESEVQVG